uniref:Uncharacterized protein n=1 Tax=Moniliophthora roreri TaxID=221103 RepID=A0A0W0G471_MONRR
MAQSHFVLLSLGQHSIFKEEASEMPKANDRRNMTETIPRSHWYKELSLAELQQAVVGYWGLDLAMPLYNSVPFSVHRLQPPNLNIY